MAFSNDYLLNVDIKNTYSISTPTFRQGDNGTLRFKIFDGNKLFDLTGLTDAKVVCKLPSEKTFEGSAILNDKGEIEYELSPELETSEEGYVQVILSVYSGESVASVQPFNIYMYDNNLSRNTQDVDILKGLIQQVQNLIVQVDELLVDVNNAVTDVNDLKTELQDIFDSEAQRELNEAQRIANELVRESNEQTRISNETERIQHESDRQTQFQQNQATIDTLIPLVDNVENKGQWNNSTQYKKNNIVRFNGSSFMALQDTVGESPPILPITSSIYWNLLAQRGLDGDGGTTRSVNGIDADVTGNIELTPNDIDAYSKTEINNISGNLNNLTTTNKSNLVGAISEVKNEISNHLLAINPHNITSEIVNTINRAGITPNTLPSQFPIGITEFLETRATESLLWRDALGKSSLFNGYRFMIKTEAISLNEFTTAFSSAIQTVTYIINTGDNEGRIEGVYTRHAVFSISEDRHYTYTWSPFTKQFDYNGGEMTNILTAYSNTSYTLRQVRNIILTTSTPTVDMLGEGDIGLVYEE